MKPRLRTLILVLVLNLLCSASYGQAVAIKTNALSLALGTPDLGAELVTGEHSSVALSLFGNSHPYGWDCSLFAIQPEFRYWFNGRPLTREFIGGVVTGVTYDIVANDRVFRGDAISIGLSGGYVWGLGKRWSLEASGGFGFLLFRQKQYFKGDNYDDTFPGGVTKVNNSGYKLFPSKLAITFIYIIK